MSGKSLLALNNGRVRVSSCHRLYAILRPALFANTARKGRARLATRYDSEAAHVISSTILTYAAAVTESPNPVPIAI